MESLSTNSHFVLSNKLEYLSRTVASAFQRPWNCSNKGVHDGYGWDIYIEMASSSLRERERWEETAGEGQVCSIPSLKYTPNHHYNASLVEPWGERGQRGYGVEILRRFFEEVAFVEFSGPPEQRPQRLRQMRALAYNELSADRPTVAVVQALEAILQHQAAGHSDCVVTVNEARGGLVLWAPGQAEAEILYPGSV